MGHRLSIEDRLALVNAEAAEFALALKRYGEHAKGCKGRPQPWFRKSDRQMVYVDQPSSLCTCGLGPLLDRAEEYRRHAESAARAAAGGKP